MIKEITAEQETLNSPCLLLGNGINRLFNDSSWKDLISNELKKSNNSLSYREIKQMPATMQIVAATNGSVGSRMKDMSDELMNISLSDDRTAFLQEILQMPITDILTTNYSFELEIADGMMLSKRQYSAKLRSTFDLKHRHKRFRLFQYYETETGKRIWHIHGDAAKPDTMMMGHYYYAKQLSDLQECIAKSVQRYKICEKKGEVFQSYSWVDRFLTTDVYILGLGMYLCEDDLWYLLCCKKKNFPETKVYFFDKDCSNYETNIMLRTYGVQIISGSDLSINESGNTDLYKSFYSSALHYIRTKIISKSV